MKYLEKEKSIKFKNGNVTAYEYPMNDPDINCALVEIKGRHPEEGWLINEKCKELIFVVSGSGNLITEQKKAPFKQGDMLIIDPQEKYFWNADCTLLTPCTPAWTPEQNKLVK